MRASIFTEAVRASITPSIMRDLKQFAAEDGVSVSTYFRRVIADHLIANGWDAPQSERDAIYRQRRLRVIRRGSVYLIKCGSAYKIGRTRNLSARLSQMSLAYKPRIIRVVEFEDPGFVELALHEMFSACRLNGEWFSLSEEDVIRAKEYMSEKSG